MRTISQRELRNDSGAVLREVEGGATLLVTRNGTAVAELRPVRRYRVTTVSQWRHLVSTVGRVDAALLREDLDREVDPAPADRFSDDMPGGTHP